MVFPVFVKVTNHTGLWDDKLTWYSFVEIIFLNDKGLCWRDFFHLHQRKWISDVTRTNTIFDVEVGNRKVCLFGRTLWWEQTAQKGAPRLTAENHVVWRNFTLNRKILSSFKFNYWVSCSKGDIYNCRMEAILSRFLPSNCYAMNTKIMNAEHEAVIVLPFKTS